VNPHELDHDHLNAQAKMAIAEIVPLSRL